MPDISKDIEIKIATTPDRGMDEYAKQAEKAGRQAAELAKTLQSIAKDAGFDKKARDVEGYGRAVEGTRRKVDELAQAERRATSGPSFMDRLLKGRMAGREDFGFQQMTEKRLFGRMGVMGGAAGQLAGGLRGAAGGLGGMALAGLGPAGMGLMGLDTITTHLSEYGNKERAQRQEEQNFAIQNNAIDVGARSHAADIQQSAAERMRHLMLPTAQAMTFSMTGAKASQSDLLRAQAKNLDSLVEGARGDATGFGRKMAGLDIQAAAARGDVADWQGKEEKMRKAKGWAGAGSQNVGAFVLDTSAAIAGDEKRSSHPEKKRMEAQTQLAKIDAEAAAAAKQGASAQKRIADLMQQRLDIQKKIVDAEREQIKGKLESFSDLDPMQQMRAIELGGRLKKGEKLEGADLEEAQGIGVLSDLVKQQKMSDKSTQNSFLQFLNATGSDSEKAFADKVKATGNFDITLQIDEAKLADEIAAKTGGQIKAAAAAAVKAVEKEAEKRRDDEERRRAEAHANAG